MGQCEALERFRWGWACAEKGMVIKEIGLGGNGEGK